MRAKISEDLKTAMKAGDKQRVGTLRLINAAIQSAEIEAKKPIDDAAVLAVMTKMVKQRRDSIEQYTNGGRPDLAAVEQAEIAIIEAYLPKQMDDSAVAAAVAAASCYQRWQQSAAQPARNRLGECRSAVSGRSVQAHQLADDQRRSAAYPFRLDHQRKCG